jgi:hypothetical protein
VTDHGLIIADNIGSVNGVVDGSCIQQLVRELAEPLRDREPVNFLAEFAFTPPVVVIAEYRRRRPLAPRPAVRSTP